MSTDLHSYNRKAVQSFWLQRCTSSFIIWRVMKVWEIWMLREVFLHPTMKCWTEHPKEVSDKNSCAWSQRMWLLEMCFLVSAMHTLALGDIFGKEFPSPSSRSVWKVPARSERLSGGLPFPVPHTASTASHRCQFPCPAPGGVAFIRKGNRMTHTRRYIYMYIFCSKPCVPTCREKHFAPVYLQSPSG